MGTLVWEIIGYFTSGNVCYEKKLIANKSKTNVEQMRRQSALGRSELTLEGFVCRQRVITFYDIFSLHFAINSFVCLPSLPCHHQLSIITSV